jgi:serine/threonine protein kinase
VLLMKDGSVKLADFGVARVLAAGAMAHTWTGTPTYLAPEVWNGETYGPKADVWSLGCLLYEMCMKRTPFEAKSVAAICTKVLRGKYTPISGPYSPNVARLITRMLVRNSRDRPSAGELLRLPIVKQFLGPGGTGSVKATAGRRASLDVELPAGRKVAYRRPARAVSPPPPRAGIHGIANRRVQKKSIEFDDDESTARDRPVEGRRPVCFRPPPELLRSIISTRNQPVYTGVGDAVDGFNDE